MKKWYDEEYEFEIEVIGFLRGGHTERYCRNGEEIGDKYTCTYGCPINQDGYGICSKVMTVLFPIMEAVRSGGDLENIGGDSPYSKVIVCPDGCVMFRLTARKLGNENFFKGKFFDEPISQGNEPNEIKICFQSGLWDIEKSMIRDSKSWRVRICRRERMNVHG